MTGQQPWIIFCIEAIVFYLWIFPGAALVKALGIKRKISWLTALAAGPAVFYGCFLLLFFAAEKLGIAVSPRALWAGLAVVFTVFALTFLARAQCKRNRLEIVPGSRHLANTVGTHLLRELILPSKFSGVFAGGKSTDRAQTRRISCQMSHSFPSAFLNAWNRGRATIGALVGTAVAAYLQLQLFISSLRTPLAVHVGWDGYFHLSALRAEIMHPTASFSGLSDLFSSDFGLFYPPGFHLLANILPLSLVETPLKSYALLATVSAGSYDPALRINLLLFLSCGILLPLGISALAKEIFTPTRLGYFARYSWMIPGLAAFFSLNSLYMPALLLGTRASIPMGVSVCLVPAVLALICTGTRGQCQLEAWVLAALAAVALAWVQPAAVIVLGIFALPFICLVLGRFLAFELGLHDLVRRYIWKRKNASAAVESMQPARRGRLRKIQKIYASCFWLLLIFSAVGAYLYLRSNQVLQGVLTYGRSSVGDNDWQRLWWSLSGEYPNLDGHGKYLIVTLLFVGVLGTLLWCYGRSIIVIWAEATLLLWGALKVNWFGKIFTGFFYHDFPRLGALVVIPVAILLAVAVVFIGACFAGILAYIYRLLWRLDPSSKNAQIPGFLRACCALVCALLITGGVYSQSAHFDFKQRVNLLEMKYISPDHVPSDPNVAGWEELEFIRRTSQNLSADALIIGSPFIGTNFFYALGGKKAYIRSLSSEQENSPAKYLRFNFNKYLQDDEVCVQLDKIAQRAGVSGQAIYVFLSSPREVEGASPEKVDTGLFYVPLKNLTSAYQYIDKKNPALNATLYSFTGCAKDKNGKE